MHQRPDDSVAAKCFHPSREFTVFPPEDVEISVAERFEKIVRMYPDRVAVKKGSRTETYEQLNKAANRLAHALMRRMEAVSRPIALFFDPGVESITAMLAALKTGQCYVPLDPGHSAARMRSVLEDSEADLIVTDAENYQAVTKVIGGDVPVLNIDTLPPDLAETHLSEYPPPGTPSFIIYTSGSTGKPKGVLHTHRTMLHTVMSLTNLVHVCAQDRVALLLSYSFSASIRQVFAALLNGAVLLPFNTKKEGLAPLIDWLDREAVTLCGFTGSMFREFLFQSAAVRPTYSSLRTCFVGSESLSKRDVQLYKRHLPDHVILVANMGINESGTIGNLLIDKSTEIAGNTVPVGYASADKEIVLLNEAGEKVGFDAVGEITVKSKYLSPGYWKQPELTAMKFIAADCDSEMRVYYTGDLGRMSPDGCLNYLGRKDLAVKIRGSTVDTPRVEAALLGHPRLKQAAVVAQQNSNGDAELIAYIVPTRRPGPNPGQLRRLLTETLPESIIPSLYVELDALPLTSTGKIDRKSLPEPTRCRPSLDVTYVGSRNETERQLIKIWEDVLDIRPVGVLDNFFDLGGQSLSFTRIVYRVFRDFHVRIPVQELFLSPTVAKMAAKIADHRGEAFDKEQLENLLNQLESLSDEDAIEMIKAGQWPSGK